MSGIVRSSILARARRLGIGRLSVALLASVSFGRAAPSFGQVSLATRESVLAVPSPASAAAATGIRRVAAGEKANYKVELAGRGVGSGSLEVLGEEAIGGFKTLHASLHVSGGLPFLHVDDRLDSWFDADGLFSRRFIQDNHEIGHTRYRSYEISPEGKTFRQVDNGENGVLPTNQPLDDVSFLFYARTLPLRVGDVDTIPRYFKAGRDVILNVVRKERVTVPAGTFETIVVQPTITNAGGLFGQGGKAELYFSDDSARTLVMMKTRVPVIGSLTLLLKDFHPAP